MNNLINLDTERLVYVFCDVKGSYIANAYFESAFIGERSREKMIWKLKVVNLFIYFIIIFKNDCLLLGLLYNIGNIEDGLTCF